MSTKRIVGCVVLIVGIVLIIFSVYEMNRISRAKGAIHTLSSPFSGSSAGKTAGHVMEGKASQYDTPVMILLIGGIACTVVGGYLVLFCKKKKR
ncbi:MAG TPA: hypothetical protein VGJ00_07260 [Rhabdochlamydiaceae bacterium]|jgi:hypothetical protein